MPVLQIDATRCCACGSDLNHNDPRTRSCGLGILCFPCFQEIAGRRDRHELAFFGIRQEALDALEDEEEDLARLIMPAELLGELSNRGQELLADHGDRGRDRDRRRS